MAKYVTYQNVDLVTGVPVSIEPAANGQVAPEGVRFGFALESQYPTSNPVFYGMSSSADDQPGILSVITKAEYDTAYAQELEARKPKAPIVVSMRQARLALLAAGHLAKVNKAIAEAPGPAGEASRIEWDYATELRRDHPLVAGLGQQLGLDDAAIDALFIAASQIS